MGWSRAIFPFSNHLLVSMCFCIASKRLCFMILAGTEMRSTDQSPLWYTFQKMGEMWLGDCPQDPEIHLIRSHRPVHIYIPHMVSKWTFLYHGRSHFSPSPDLEEQGLDTGILNKLKIESGCPSLPSAFT